MCITVTQRWIFKDFKNAKNHFFFNLIYFRYTTKMSIQNSQRVGRCPSIWRAFVLVTQLISEDQVGCWFTRAKVCRLEIHCETKKSYESSWKFHNEVTQSTFLQDHLQSGLIRNQTLSWKPQNMLAWSLVVQVITSSCILLLYQFLERNKTFPVSTSLFYFL